MISQPQRLTMALCLVTLGGAAAAQTAPTVTMYGSVDANITRLRADGKGSMWQMRDGGQASTRLGFTGTEQLGAGWRTHFVLESQFNSDTGSGANNASPTNQPASTNVSGGLTFLRKSALSLITPAGEIRMGRDYTATFVPPTYFDPFLSAGVASATNFQAYFAPGLHLPPLVRASNVVAYYIPPTLVPGLYGYVQHAFAEGSGANYDGLGTGYRKGPLLLSAAVGRSRNPLAGSSGLSAATTSPDNTLKLWSLGGSYDFSGFKLMGFVHSQTLAHYGPTAALTERNRRAVDALVGFSWTMGAHVVKASWLKRDERSRANNDATQLGLGYTYNLSKRTAFYANLATFSNRNSGSFNFASSGATPAPGGKAEAVQAGLGHTF